MDATLIPSGMLVLITARKKKRIEGAAKKANAGTVLARKSCWASRWISCSPQKRASNGTMYLSARVVVGLVRLTVSLKMAHKSRRATSRGMAFADLCQHTINGVRYNHIIHVGTCRLCRPARTYDKLCDCVHVRLCADTIMYICLCGPM